MKIKFTAENVAFIRDLLQCPVSKERMQIPILLGCGHTIGGESMRQCAGKCPICQQSFMEGENAIYVYSQTIHDMAKLFFNEALEPLRIREIFLSTYDVYKNPVPPNLLYKDVVAYVLSPDMMEEVESEENDGAKDEEIIYLEDPEEESLLDLAERLIQEEGSFLLLEKEIQQHMPMGKPKLDSELKVLEEMSQFVREKASTSVSRRRSSWEMWVEWNNLRIAVSRFERSFPKDKKRFQVLLRNERSSERKKEVKERLAKWNQEKLKEIREFKEKARQIAQNHQLGPQLRSYAYRQYYRLVYQLAACRVTLAEEMLQSSQPVKNSDTKRLLLTGVLDHLRFAKKEIAGLLLAEDSYFSKQYVRTIDKWYLELFVNSLYDKMLLLSTTYQDETVPLARKYSIQQIIALKDQAQIAIEALVRYPCDDKNKEEKILQWRTAIVYYLARAHRDMALLAFDEYQSDKTQSQHVSEAATYFYFAKEGIEQLFSAVGRDNVRPEVFKRDLTELLKSVTDRHKEFTKLSEKEKEKATKGGSSGGCSIC